MLLLASSCILLPSSSWNFCLLSPSIGLLKIVLPKEILGCITFCRLYSTFHDLECMLVRYEHATSRTWQIAYTYGSLLRPSFKACRILALSSHFSNKGTFNKHVKLTKCGKQYNAEFFLAMICFPHWMLIVCTLVRPWDMCYLSPIFAMSGTKPKCFIGLLQEYGYSHKLKTHFARMWLPVGSLQIYFMKQSTWVLRHD